MRLSENVILLSRGGHREVAGFPLATGVRSLKNEPAHHPRLDLILVTT